MKDAVAEVLGQRRDLNGVPAWHFAASVALHLAIVAAVVVSAMRAPSTPTRPVLNVRLASPGRSAAPSGGAPAARSKVREPEKRIEPETKTAPKEQPRTAAPEPKKTSRGSAVFGRSNLPAPTKSMTTPTPSKTATDNGASSGNTGAGGGLGAMPGVGQAGVAGLEGGDFPYPTYLDRMIGLVGARWFRPQAASEMIVQVYFVVERNGRVRDWKVEKSSGSALFDRAALRAVIESSPLPPLPLGYSGTYLGVHLTFH